MEQTPEDLIKFIDDAVAKKGYRIKFMPQTLVSDYADEIETIRKTLGINSWWVSDASTIGDFDTSAEERAQLSVLAGFGVTDATWLVHIAAGMRAVNNLVKGEQNDSSV